MRREKMKVICVCSVLVTTVLLSVVTIRFCMLQDVDRQQLFLAASYGDEKALRNLLDKYPQWIDLRGSANRTLLHLAARKGDEKAVVLLLVRGASVDVVDKYGRTPLDEAERHGNKHVAEIIQQWTTAQKRNYEAGSSGGGPDLGSSSRV